MFGYVKNTQISENFGTGIFFTIEMLSRVYYIVMCRSLDSMVGIATGYRLGDRGFRVWVPVGSRIFSSPRRSDRRWGPPILLSNGFWSLFPRG
jgi:hypothetical protein